VVLNIFDVEHGTIPFVNTKRLNSWIVYHVKLEPFANIRLQKFSIDSFSAGSHPIVHSAFFATCTAPVAHAQTGAQKEEDSNAA